MKLTNTLRDAFIRAAMDDVPSVDYQEKIRVAAQADAVAQLPPKVRTLHADKSLSHYISTENMHFFGTWVNVPCSDRHFKLSDKALHQCRAWEKDGNGQAELRRELKTKLHAVAYACTTRKQLHDMLPEFEKYMPADEVAANRSLPVLANVVSDFVKAGWPKGAAKPKAKKAA